MVLKLFRDWLNMTFKMFDNSSKKKKKASCDRSASSWQ